MLGYLDAPHLGNSLVLRHSPLVSPSRHRGVSSGAKRSQSLRAEVNPVGLTQFSRHIWIL